MCSIYQMREAQGRMWAEVCELRLHDKVNQRNESLIHGIDIVSLIGLTAKRCSMKLAMQGVFTYQRRSRPTQFFTVQPKENCTEPPVGCIKDNLKTENMQKRKDKAIHKPCKQVHKSDARKDKVRELNSRPTRVTRRLSSNCVSIKRSCCTESEEPTRTKKTKLSDARGDKKTGSLSEYHLRVVAALVELSVLPLLPDGEPHDDICAACYSKGQIEVVEGETVICCSFCNEVSAHPTGIPCTDTAQSGIP